MKNDILKMLALKAKNRLIHKTTGEDFPNKSDCRIRIIKSGDSDFYDKVKSLLERDEDLTNPIKELMDDELLSSMSSGAKEKYLFETIDKYQKIKSEIESEKALKIVY